MYGVFTESNRLPCFFLLTGLNDWQWLNGSGQVVARRALFEEVNTPYSVSCAVVDYC